MYMSSIFAACISSALMGCVSSCESSPLRDRIMGFGCAWDNRVNFTNVAEHECVLRCMFDKSCTAVNYDVQDRVCMCVEVPCPVLEIQQYIHYQILAPPPLDGCVHWVATNDRNYPRMVKYNSSPNGYNLIGIVRLRRAGKLLPAVWSQRNEKAVTVQNNTKFMSKAIEVLVAKESCSLRWVNYDASSGNALPPGAILGGHLADGTPLYVAIPCLTSTGDVAGYYNHDTRGGTCHYGRVRRNHGNIRLITTP